MGAKEVLRSQLRYYQELIKDAPDAETAVDILDGVDLIYAAHVIDTKFGVGTTQKILNGGNK